MYNLTIHFGPNAVAWSFLFKDAEKAEAARTTANVAMCQRESCAIEDEYGQKASFAANQINGVLLEDTELGQEARILRGLDQARGQARATQRAKTDPELSRMMTAQGPGVLTPFANGGFRPQ